ncbi:MAG: hypothetical protein KC613_01565, partial [Myxococcales bacterium]|nr:hypothetical protein [Myxococcales bacterium]
MGVLIHTWAAPLLALILVSPAAAQRVAVLARVAPAPAADAFTADLEAALLTHGLRPIDPAQSRAMRSVNDAGQIMAEGLSALTVPLDADYLLVAVGDAQPLPDEFGGGAFRALGAVRLKLITVATGEVVATASHEGATQHFTQVSALGRALSASGRAAAQALLRQRADRPTHPLTLVLEGCDPVARCQAALATLGRQPDVAGVEVVQLAPTASKVEVRLVGGGGAALVARLGLVPDLAPVAFTHDTVRARLTPPPPPPPKLPPPKLP